MLCLGLLRTLQTLCCSSGPEIGFCELDFSKLSRGTKLGSGAKLGTGRVAWGFRIQLGDRQISGKETLSGGSFIPIACCEVIGALCRAGFQHARQKVLSLGEIATGRNFKPVPGRRVIAYAALFKVKTAEAHLRHCHSSFRRLPAKCEALGGIFWYAVAVNVEFGQWTERAEVSVFRRFSIHQSGGRQVRRRMDTIAQTLGKIVLRRWNIPFGGSAEPIAGDGGIGRATPAELMEQTDGELRQSVA